MKVSVIILNYKVPLLVEQCLHSVFSSIERCGRDVDVWVVDNNSEDGSYEYLTERFPLVRFIASKENVGFSRGNNLALEQCSGDYILLLNPDTVITEETLLCCIDHLDNHPEVGAVGVRMVNGFGRFLPESKRGLPTPWHTFCRMAGLYKLFPHSSFFNHYYMGHLKETGIHAMEVLSGAFLFMRKEVRDGCGLLDDRFFMYGEDIDYSYRILKAGWKIHYLPTPIIHYKGEAERASSNPDRYLNSFYGAMELFYDKHFAHKKFLRPLIIVAIRWKKKMARRSLLNSSSPKQKEQQKGKNIPTSSKNPQYRMVWVDGTLEAIPIVSESKKTLPKEVLPPSGSHLLFSLYTGTYLNTLQFMMDHVNLNYSYSFYTENSGQTISSVW